MATKQGDRVERLTNLLALLLETRVPLTQLQITAELDQHYPDGDRARRGAFERDKAALRELGVPIDTTIIDAGPDAGSSRYAIDRRKYELADLDLDVDEMRALQVAVAAVRSGSSAGRDAIWKLGGDLSAGDRLPVTAVMPDRPELPALRAAVASRSAISFSYRGEQRHLQPYGLLLRGGFWYVVGHDLDRGERRTFRVDRFATESVEVGEPGTFERPPSFDPRDAFPADPKQIGHAPSDGIEAVVRVGATRAAAIERELGADRVVDRHPDGSVDLSVPASNLDAFRSWVLGLLDHAVVLGPPEVRADIVAWVGGLAGR
ncbi:MAG: WYL domain-containing protein [Ilumatobacter sp.]|nr:WYL domain-containing protein [Ilumatobacter sp.]